jgi:hypothetical protein
MKQKLIEALRERQAELKQSWDVFLAAHEVLVGAIQNYNEVLEDCEESGEWEEVDLDPLDLPEYPHEPDMGHADALSKPE